MDLEAGGGGGKKPAGAAVITPLMFGVFLPLMFRHQTTHLCWSVLFWVFFFTPLSNCYLDNSPLLGDGDSISSNCGSD